MDNIKKLSTLQDHSGFDYKFYEDRYQHCALRYEERFNSTMSYDEWQELNLRVFLEQGAQYLDLGDGIQSSLYVVDHEGVKTLMAFSEVAYCLMTILPRSDSRLFHFQTNSYTMRACKDADFYYRNQRRELAENFESLTDNGYGRLVLPKHVRKAEESEQPEVASPFVDALADFKPVARPILSLPKPAPVPTPESEIEQPADTDAASNAEVLGLFAKLDARFREQNALLDQQDEETQDEIAALEERIELLRTGDEGRRMSREFVDMSKNMAVMALEKYQTGLISEASALAMAEMMLAQAPRKEASNTVPITRNFRAPAKAHGDGPAPFSDDNPEPFRRGNGIYYRLDGVERNQGEWAAMAGITASSLAYRLANGWTFREAIRPRQKRA